MKRMPRTGASFMTGSAALSGLPPLNGFPGEFLLVMAALAGIASPGPTAVALWSLAALAGIAFTAGLAVAAFARLTGMACLGHPRSEAAAKAHESGASLRAPMGLLAALCLASGLASPWVAERLAPALAGLPGGAAAGSAALASVTLPLLGITASALAFCALAALLAAARARLLAGREVTSAVTWDCGYARPAASMQYSASSFARPLVLLFQPVLRLATRLEGVEGFFPRRAALAESAPDVFSERFFKPLAAWVVRRTDAVRAMQSGRLHLYILYILLTLVGLLVWRMRLP
jgi:NADH:ubiquinone oxidoreductase subunit 5 (subunit L)/multisubunit Na+/H+ antiporter MnhA subunit